MADFALDEPSRIAQFLLDTPLAPPGSRVVPLTGDASDRKYFRVIPPAGAPLVLALHASPIQFSTLPFANVARLLTRVPLPVPAILGHSDDLGIVALEDLGDVTLQAHLGVASPKAHASLYREAIALIEVLQRRGAELADPQYLPYRIAFDVEKLTWELNFFVRHYLEAFRGVSLTAEDRTVLAAEWSAIVDELAGEAEVVCHRDYHSRNLMLHGGKLYMIDFQDARLGPDTYDLVSLLRDSYVDFTEEQLEGHLDYYLALQRRPGLVPGDFRRRFDLMSLQRNLKALGTFGYQTTTRRNPVYLQYVPRTLSYARTNLVKYPRFARLHGVLARHIEELQ